MNDGYEPRWDRDLERGKQGEMFAHRIAQMSRDGSGTVEVKTDAWWMKGKEGRVFVEQACFRQGRWRMSGISTTQALYWTFVAGKHALELTISTEWLRRAVKHAVERDHRNGEAKCDKGSHPTRGTYVYWHDIRTTRDETLDEH